MENVILVLNLIASLVSAGWGALAFARPSTLSRSKEDQSGEVFYARMYAVRAIPFGLITAFIPFLWVGSAVVCVLLVAAVVQLADLAIAIGRRDFGMGVGSAIGAMVHGLCGIFVMYL